MTRNIALIALAGGLLAGCAEEPPASADLCTDAGVGPAFITYFEDNYWRYVYAIMRQDGWGHFYDPQRQNAVFDGASVEVSEVEQLSGPGDAYSSVCVADVTVTFDEPTIQLIDRTLAAAGETDREMLAQYDGVGLTPNGVYARIHYAVAQSEDATWVDSEDAELLLYSLARYSAIAMIGNAAGADLPGLEAQPDALAEDMVDPSADGGEGAVQDE